LISYADLCAIICYRFIKNIVGPRPVIEQCFQDGYITDGVAWMRMNKSRNLTSHTYDENVVNEIIEDIRTVYFMLLKNLQIKLEEEKAGN